MIHGRRWLGGVALLMMEECRKYPHDAPFRPTHSHYCFQLVLSKKLARNQEKKKESRPSVR